MKICLFIIICFLFSTSIFASECKIIQLQTNQSIDQTLSNNSEVSQEDSELCEIIVLDTNVEKNDNEATIILKELDQLIDYSKEDLSAVNEVILLPDLWKKTNKEDLNFLLDNITDINSPTLRYELLSLLNIDNLPPKNLDKVDFENLVIRNLLKFGEREKAYKIFN